MGWTQTEAGDALGVTLRQVARYESGEQGISEKTEKLCKMLKERG
jgi:transcriptional regulator with XRE-family HTH domain